MEQYPVPQFIEDEARITSFLTFRQFIYIAIAGIILVILYKTVPLPIFIVCAIIIGGTALTLSFVKVNGIPVLNMVLGSLGFLIGSKNFTWKKKESLYPFKTIQRAPLKKVEQETIGVSQSSGLKRLKDKVELK